MGNGVKIHILNMGLIEDTPMGRPKKHTPKQMENALLMLSINGGKYSYKEVEEITNISKSTLIREMRKRKER